MFDNLSSTFLLKTAKQKIAGRPFMNTVYGTDRKWFECRSLYCLCGVITKVAEIVKKTVDVGNFDISAT